MSRQRALGAKILGGRHDATAKEDLPEAINGDAGSERMAWIGESAGQAKPVAWRILGETWQRAGSTAAHRLCLGRVVVAAP